MISDKANWKPTALVIGPGGIKGLEELGLLSFLETINLINDVNTIVGCSAGAIIGLLLICGYSAGEIISEVLPINLFSDICSISLSDLKTNLGILGHDILRRNIKKLIKAKYGLVPTFKQLYSVTGIRFIVVAYNLDKKKYIAFSAESDPELDVVEAVIMSSNIPIAFQKMTYNGDTIIDGAFGNPYPIDIIDDGRTDILGIYIDDDHTRYKPNESILPYINSVLHSSLTTIRDIKIATSTQRCRHVKLVCVVDPTGGFTYSQEDKIKMVVHGYQTGEKIYKEWLEQGMIDPALLEEEEIDTGGVSTVVVEPDLNDPEYIYLPVTQANLREIEEDNIQSYPRQVETNEEVPNGLPLPHFVPALPRELINRDEVEVSQSISEYMKIMERNLSGLTLFR